MEGVRAVPIVIDPVIVSLYHDLVSNLICTVSQLFTIPVAVPLIADRVVQLMIRYPEVVRGSKDNVASTGIFTVPAVYTSVVYQLFNCAEPLHRKFTPSGVVSQIAKSSAIYFVGSYCDGICTSAFPLSYLTGTFCLYILSQNI